MLQSVLQIRIRIHNIFNESGFRLGCPHILIGSETKRNGSENERSEIAKKMVSFACFALKRNGIFWMRNEMIRSEKYRKYRKSSQFRETRNQNLEYIFAILQNINDFFKDKKNIQNCILLEHVHLMYCTLYTVHSTVYTRRF